MGVKRGLMVLVLALASAGQRPAGEPTICRR